MKNIQMSFYEERLQKIKSKGRHRQLLRRQDIWDFTSHDYLALSSSTLLREKILSSLDSKIPIGSGGSRLLCGNYNQHLELEEEAADFFGFEKMLYFGSGYAANMAILSTLPQATDLIVYDKLVHASIREGINSGKAQAIAIPHNNINSFAENINKWRKSGGKGFPWIVVESIYSMDGDKAPLDDLVKIANDYDGFIVVDEAHATGVCGPLGKGLTHIIEERNNVIVMHSCSKALGSSGALVGSNKIIYDYLINYAKPFIYTTSPSPILAVVACEALKLIKRKPALHKSGINTRFKCMKNIQMSFYEERLQKIKSMNKYSVVRGTRSPPIPSMIMESFISGGLIVAGSIITPSISAAKCGDAGVLSFHFSGII